MSPSTGSWGVGVLEPKPTALWHEAKSPAHFRVDIQRQATSCTLFHTRGQVSQFTCTSLECGRTADPERSHVDMQEHANSRQKSPLAHREPSCCGATMLTTLLLCFSRQESCCKSCFWQLDNQLDRIFLRIFIHWNGGRPSPNEMLRAEWAIIRSWRPNCSNSLQ